MEQIYRMKNAEMEVEINLLGGQIWSLRDTEGTQYLWQGDANYWKDRAIHLFPYIARLTEGTYRLYGQEYSMDIHGFLKDSVMQMEVLEKERILLSLEDTQETRAQYPYHFTLKIEYALRGSKLDITYRVENKDTKKMFFGIGGHPGFNVPLERELGFEDYYLEFSGEAEVIRVGMSKDCFVTDGDEKLALQEGKILPLTHNQFDDDAIIIKNMSKEISLTSKKGTKGLTVSFPQMNYLGIWHMPHTNAPYVCIEPWTSLPSRKDVVEKLEEQDNLIGLDKNKVYVNQWSIQLNK